MAMDGSVIDNEVLGLNPSLATRKALPRDVTKHVTPLLFCLMRLRRGFPVSVEERRDLKNAFSEFYWLDSECSQTSELSCCE